MNNCSLFLLVLVALVVVMVVTGMTPIHDSRKIEYWISILEEEHSVLLADIDEEKRLLVQMKQQVTKEQAARQAELSALREEVALLQTEVAAQQQKVKETQEDAAKTKTILEGLLDEARRMRDEATLKADEDSRRLCEVLTEERPALKPLCHKMSQQPDPEILKTINWLYKKATNKQYGSSHAITSQGLLARLSMLWLAWLLVSWWLLRPLFNRRTSLSQLRLNKRISSLKRKKH